jgi:hypothetical protein
VQRFVRPTWVELSSLASEVSLWRVRTGWDSPCTRTDRQAAIAHAVQRAKAWARTCRSAEQTVATLFWQAQYISAHRAGVLEPQSHRLEDT